MKRIGKTKALALVQSGALLVDMRSPVAFRDGHVDGAVNLPLRNFVNRIMPLDKKTKIIIYSDAITDADLRHGTTYANNLGFTEVFVADYKTLTEETRVHVVKDIPKVSRGQMDRVRKAARNPSRKRAYPKA